VKLTAGWCGLVAVVSLVLQANGVEVDRYVEKLGSSDRELRREAAYQLSVMNPGAKSALPALIRALDDLDRQVWAFAVTAIARLGPDAAPAIPKLIAGIDSRTAPGVRPRDKAQTIQRSAYALARIGDAAKPELLKALKGDDTGLRIGAAKAFAIIGSSAVEAVPGLIENLGHNDPEVRAEMVEALVAIGKPAIPSLVSSVGWPDPKIRAGSARALGGIGADASEAAPALLKLASEDSEMPVRAAALSVLPKLGLPQERSVPVLISALKHADVELNRAAADGLLLVRPAGPVAVPSLLALLKEPAFSARAAVSLGRYGRDARGAVPELIALAAKAPAEAQPYVDALISIGSAAVPGALEEVAKLAAVDPTHWTVHVLEGIGAAGLPELQKALENKKPAVRTAALLAIRRLGVDARDAREAVTRLASDSNEKVRAAALPAMVAVGVKAPGVLEPIENALADKSPAVRIAASDAAAQLREAARPISGKIAGLLSDGELSVRIAATEALGAIGGSGEWMAQLLRGLDEPKLQLATVSAVAKLRPSGVAPKLVAMYPGASREVRVAILDAVGGMGEGAIPVLETAVNDTDPTVRAAALRATARNKPNLDTFIPVLAKALTDPATEVRTAGAEAVSSMPAKDRLVPLVQPLLEMAALESDRTLALDTLRGLRLRDPQLIALGLDSSSIEVKVWAIERLGRMGAQARPAREKLEQYARDSNDYVRRASRRALQEIGR
jgi:HEAT repeat protein